jgi:phenylpropionate dioxygenase-like ring-hydroxylating dioxygenase large terminal subunit
MTTTEAGTGDGVPRSAGPSVQELLATDTRAVPVSLRDHSYVTQGVTDVAKHRYTSAAFAALEAEYLWTRTWQMACHVDELVNAGDHVVYDVAGQSLIVVRTQDGSIKAFHNACLHRGTKLRVDDGRVASFRCPFHGWRWDLDGTLVELPAEWDFPQIWEDPVRSALPQASVAMWEGFVFVNMDPHAPPFEDYASILVEHFDRDFDMAGRYKAFHAVKEVPANWKVCMEAFSEGYHVIATHPQILEFTADENSEYSIWPDNPYVTRFVNGFGSQSPHLGGLTEQQVANAYLAFSVKAARAGQGSPGVEVPEGSNARQVVAEIFRGAMAERFGADMSQVSDSEILDAVLYHLFPAFAPWAGIGQPLVYRWRPGATPDTCFMDVIRMAPVPDGEPRPEPAPVQRLRLEQRWTEAEGMAGLADVFEQDMANLPRVQAGLKSTAGKTGVSFGRYMEARLRMWHRLIDQFIERGLGADGRDSAELAPYRVAPG